MFKAKKKNVVGAVAHSEVEHFLFVISRYPRVAKIIVKFFLIYFERKHYFSGNLIARKKTIF